MVEVTDSDRVALRTAWNEYASWMGDPEGNDDTKTAFEEAAKIIAAHREAGYQAGAMAMQERALQRVKVRCSIGQLNSDTRQLDIALNIQDAIAALDPTKVGDHGAE